MKNLTFLLILLLVSCQQDAKDKKTPEIEVEQLEAIGNQIDTLETYQTPIQVNSPLRPNELLFLNTIYTDTLEFIDYNDDYDYRYLIGNKNDKEVSLAYNWDWFDNEEYNFLQGDEIVVQWQLDSIAMPGDEEAMDIVEMALDAKKIASSNQPIQFLKRKNAYNEAVKDTISTLVINHSYLHNITPPEKAALAFVAYDIGNECEQGYDSGGNERVLWCRIVSALDLDHQCSQKQRSFLQKWFAKDIIALKKLESCPTIPNTATVQTTFDEILIQTDASKKMITVNYKVTGMNMRESQSWHYSQTDVFEYGPEHIMLVDTKKSDLTEEETNMNPDAAENIDPQLFVLALKEHILDYWKNKDYFDSIKITFTDNVLNIKGNEGFTLSNYDFNEMVINGTDNPMILYLTIANEGGGGGGNVVLEETYSLTVLGAEEFDIRHVETK
ncbi:hypothetical protein DZC72_02955 [Maribacter algicola]|uniref:Uncharacterized protein n=1 Tax=Maribacter algicola TaxID=2498892 RepID=A0A3R8R445_9FLAO|nr:hypothetical protein [Maribacter algicola]RRQ49577.1 hypothetical protein DZC72_02955 [Maribacter algicola]